MKKTKSIVTMVLSLLLIVTLFPASFANEELSGDTATNTDTSGIIGTFAPKTDVRNIRTSPTSWTGTMETEEVSTDTSTDPLSAMYSPPAVPAESFLNSQNELSGINTSDNLTYALKEMAKGNNPLSGKTDRFIVKYKAGQADAFKQLTKSLVKETASLKNHVAKHPKDEKKKDDKALKKASHGFDISQFDTLTLPEPTLPSEFADKLKAKGADKNIEYIQPDFTLSPEGFILQMDNPPEDTPVPSPPDVTPSQSPAQPVPVLVAVIDTGVDITHEQLDGFIDTDNAWNFPGESAYVYDTARPFESAHGTHIAGIIVSSARETDADVTILPLKVFHNGRAYTSDVIAAIVYANNCGASVINCSFGSSSDNPALREVMKDSNALFVCAVGNNRRNLDEVPSFPACFGLPNIVSVGSVNLDGGFSYFSSYGEHMIDITSLGRDVDSLGPVNNSGKMTGTSMSAGFVSGAAAAVLSLNPELSTTDLRGRLLTCSDRLSNLQDKVKDGRRLNLLSVLAGTAQDEVIDISPEDDFDPTGYNPTGSELLELFSASKIVQVSAGGYHSLALREDGTVWAVGRNNCGQLGNGTTTNSTTPVQVIGLAGIVEISAGENHNLALDDSGAVWAWGDNTYGQLGDSSYTARTIPVQSDARGLVPGISAKFNRSMARDDWAVYEWGGDYYGECYGSPDYFNDFSYGNHYSHEFIAAGYPDNYVIDGDSGLWRGYSWGYSYFTGDWNAVSSGIAFSLLLKNDATVYRLKDETSTIVQGLSQISLVSVWGDVGYALKTDGTVWQITSAGVVSQVSGLSGMLQISAGRAHMLALKADGTGSGMGDNTYGQLGIFVEPVAPVETTTTFNVTAGKTYTLSVVGENVTSFDGKTIKVTYTGTQFYSPESINGQGVTSNTASLGIVTFSVNKPIATNRMWSGVIGVLRFKAKITGNAAISITSV